MWLIDCNKHNWSLVGCFSFNIMFPYYWVATEWQCMLQFFLGNQMEQFFFPHLKLIAMCNVIAIPCLHEMKEEEIQREG